jgi:hypothetical protein
MRNKRQADVRGAHKIPLRVHANGFVRRREVRFFVFVQILRLPACLTACLTAGLLPDCWLPTSYNGHMYISICSLGSLGRVTDL